MGRAAPNISIRGNLDINILIAIVLGMVFLVTILVMAVSIPNPSPFQIKVFEITLAIAAGGVGAALPGALVIEKKGIFRAGGAMALVIVTLMFQSKITSSTVHFDEPPSPAEPVAAEFMELIDNNQIGAAWKALDPAAVGYSIDSYENFKILFEKVRSPLGAVESRNMLGMSSMQSPAGHPTGLYRALMFKAKYVNDGQCRAEQVVLRATNELKWKVFGYTISLAPMGC